MRQYCKRSLNKTLFASFRDTVCTAPTKYSSGELIKRSFSELFFCRTISIKALSVEGADEHWSYDNDAALVSLPCMQQCSLLRVSDAHKTEGELNGKLIDWLASNRRWKHAKEARGGG